VRGNPTITAPAGWTLLTRNSSTSVSLALYWRIAVASDASFTWTLGSSAQAAGGILSFGSVDTSMLTNFASLQKTTATTSHLAPSLTTTRENSRLLAFHDLAAKTSLTPASPMTERIDVASTGGANQVTAHAADTGLDVRHATSAPPPPPAAPRRADEATLGRGRGLPAHRRSRLMLPPPPSV